MKTLNKIGARYCANLIEASKKSKYQYSHRKVDLHHNMQNIKNVPLIPYTINQN